MSAKHPVDPGADPGAVDSRAVRRAFSRAAATYDAAAVLQREVGARMAARLDVVKLAPAAILDAGCGTGEALPELALRYPKASRVALDLALPMLTAARYSKRTGGYTVHAPRRHDARRRPAPACAGVTSAPTSARCRLRRVPLISSLAILALQWVNDLPNAFAEFRRVLNIGGLAWFTTFGPDTLKEIRTAYAGVDGHTHVNRFVDMHDIGDMLMHAGLPDPVMDMEYLTLTYSDVATLMRELRALGATNATLGRPRGLMGRRRWAQARAALDAMRRDGRIPVTLRSHLRSCVEARADPHRRWPCDRKGRPATTSVAADQFWTPIRVDQFNVSDGT